MAKTPGKQFEASFVESIPANCDVTRLKDSGGFDGKKMTNQRFASSNPCDFIIFSDENCQHECEHDGRMYKIELKSLKGKSLPYGNIKSKNDKFTALERSIKFTKALVESQKKGVWAGFIVNFRDTNQTFRVLASDVLNHLETADRASIPIAWFEKHGILIKQTLKIKHYRYNLSWL